MTASGYLSSAELEARLRPGGFSEKGFLGLTEKMQDVINRDASRLAQLDVSYEELASRLEGLIERGVRNRGRWVCAEPHAQVRVVVWKGFQICPWNVDPQQGPCAPGGEVRFASLDWRIRNNRFGRELVGPGLIVHLIRKHHFFEGADSPYRVDPEALCKLLGLGVFSARNRGG